ncbi:hypothetical protein LCGC14_1714760 [marine sediment metagenome]|uniref:PEGA domain-containing protein n=1 Tax=marine sediment metagenome TaxID=412755 RepID=A0A0F9HEL6_9ZZZZ
MKKMLMIIILLSCGCGVLIHGTRQEVSITSQPTGATVLINNEFKGTTPLTINLKRKTKEYKVVIQKNGFVPVEASIERKIIWAIEGLNTLSPDFGLIGAELIDKPTGGAYKLEPKSIHIELKKQ